MGRVAADGIAAVADVALAARGDEAAFSQLVAAYHPDMMRIAYVISGNEALAQDAVQSAWLIAWRKLHTLRDQARVRPWLMSIAVNEARQIARRGRRATIVEIQPSVAGPTRLDPAQVIGRIDLVRALDRFSADDRALIALRYLGGFELKEIALMTGRSESGTRGRLSRLITRLRGELGDA